MLIGVRSHYSRAPFEENLRSSLFPWFSERRAVLLAFLIFFRKISKTLIYKGFSALSYLPTYFSEKFLRGDYSALGV